MTRGSPAAVSSAARSASERARELGRRDRHGSFSSGRGGLGRPELRREVVAAEQWAVPASPAHPRHKK